MILTEKEYEAALQTVERYLDRHLVEGTPEYDGLNILVSQIEEYENHHSPVIQLWENDGGKDFI